MDETNEILRILVVDDSAESLKLAEYAFSGKPYDVLFANGGEQALRMLAKHHPDVVITDWMMPDVSGLEICRRIRNSRNSQDTYLILLSSNTGKKHRTQGLDAGADAYMTKPLRTEDLLAQLHAARNVLRTRRHLATNKVTS